MKGKHKFLPMALLTFGVTTGISLLGVSAYAATSGTTTATVGIQGGSLSLTAPSTSASFGNVSVGTSQQTVYSGLGNWSVSDSTGTGNGWHVTLEASQFTETAPSGGFASGTSALTLPTSSLSLYGTRTITATAGSEAISATNGPLLQNQTSTIDAGSAVTIVDTQSGYGMGSYDITEPSQGLALLINPSTAKTDPTNYPSTATPYSSTLTFSIISGP